MDKTLVKKLRITEEKSDCSYWMSQPIVERLAALESIREEYNNWKFNDQQRFQRVYRVIKQK